MKVTNNEKVGKTINIKRFLLLTWGVKKKNNHTDQGKEQNKQRNKTETDSDTENRLGVGAGNG